MFILFSTDLIEDGQRVFSILVKDEPIRGMLHQFSPANVIVLVLQIKFSARIFCDCEYKCYFLPSATMFWQGNVFTGVCQSFRSQGVGVCIPTCIGADTPQADTPWADTPLGRHPLWADTPWVDTPLGRHPPGRHPMDRHPPGQIPTNPSRRLLQRTVRILLECILAL